MKTAISFFDTLIGYSRTENFFIILGNLIKIHRINSSTLGTKDGNKNDSAIGHRKSVTVMCFSPDGTKLASFDEERQFRLWDVPTGSLTLGPVKVNRANTAAYHPNGKYIAYSSYERVYFLIPDTGEHFGEKIKTALHSYLSFSPDGLLLLVKTAKVIVNELGGGPSPIATIKTSIVSRRLGIPSFDRTSKFIAHQLDGSFITPSEKDELIPNSWFILDEKFYEAWDIESDPPKPVAMPALKEIVASAFPPPLVHRAHEFGAIWRVDVGKESIIIPSPFRLARQVSCKGIIALGAREGPIMILDCAQLLGRVS